MYSYLFQQNENASTCLIMLSMKLQPNHNSSATHFWVAGHLLSNTVLDERPVCSGVGLHVRGSLRCGAVVAGSRSLSWSSSQSSAGFTDTGEP